MTKRNKLTLIGSLAFMLFLLTYAAYAYLNSVTNINNLAIDTEISGPLTFTATGGNDLSLKVNASAMDKGKVGDVVAEGEDTMTITLETDGLEGICCSYDIIWEWDETDNEHNQYHKSKDAINEYTISASVSETYLSGGTRKSYPHDNPVMTVQVPDYNRNNLSTSIYRTSICNNSKELTTEAKQEYTLNTKVYNLNVPQDGLRGAKLASKVRVDNVSCKKQITLSDTVIAEANNNNQISSQDGSDYIVRQENVTYNSQNLDAGIRYEGKNPDNYITFNDEEWRIIGTFEGSTIGLEAGKYYTKIISSESIGEHVWAESGENDWERSDLENYLNEDYVTTLIDKDKIAHYNGSYSTWYLLGSTMDEHNNGYNAVDWYKTERYTGNPGYRDGVQHAAASSIQNAIGLMYPSDWGLAIYSKDGACNNQTTELFYGQCSEKTWLHVEWEWLMTPVSDYDYLAFSLFETYVSTDDIEVDMIARVRPTLYLEHDVLITGGSGAKNDPYTISDKKTTLSDKVISMEREDEYTSSQDSSVYIVNHEEVEYNGETLDAGVRFEGKDPNNYVTFNDEEWRIIGTFEGSTIGLEPGKQYTKIIRSESIGEISWCGESIILDNNWETSYIYEYLNGDYLQSLTDKHKIAQYNGNYSTWYLLGATELQYTTATSRDWYLIERLTGYSGSSSSTNSAIALMYPSDYGYAAYGSTCTANTAINNYGTFDDINGFKKGCSEFDWLIPTNWEFTITRSASYSESVYYISHYNGQLVIDGANTKDIRPVLYLESDVYIIEGTGSKEQPYKLDMPDRNLSETVISYEGRNEYTSSQDQSKYVVKHEEVKYNGTTYDAGIRYEGKDPDNYIQFNGDEEWRIIGTFEGSTIGLEPGKQYTKIIKATLLDYLAWDCDDEDNDGDCYNEARTDWANATLKKYLNETYLNSITDLDKIAQYNGNYSTWYLLGTDNSTVDGASEWYRLERYTGIAGYANSAQNTSISVQAAVGLMYPSDFGYSVYGTGCDNNSTQAFWDPCAYFNWLAQDALYDHYEWVISPASDNEAYVIDGNDGSTLYGIRSIDNDFAVRPTLYLESDTMITSGTGTKADPYILK